MNEAGPLLIESFDAAAFMCLQIVVDWVLVTLWVRCLMAGVVRLAGTVIVVGENVVSNLWTCLMVELLIYRVVVFRLMRLLVRRMRVTVVSRSMLALGWTCRRLLVVLVAWAWTGLIMITCLLCVPRV